MSERIAPIMDEGDEAAALAEELRHRTSERDAWAIHAKRVEAEVAELLERNKALQCELDTLRAVDEMNRPDMRSIVGELRRIHAMMKPIAWDLGARNALADLLRRLDSESEQQPTTTEGEK